MVRTQLSLMTLERSYHSGAPAVSSIVMAAAAEVRFGSTVNSLDASKSSLLVSPKPTFARTTRRVRLRAVSRLALRLERTFDDVAGEPKREGTVR
jgi:hypothetical protein